MNEKFSYDVVAYPSFVFPQTSPQKLAAAGRIHGMNVGLEAGFRYLDLGCGDGANLLLHAFDFPEGEFVGIDLSEPRILEARRHAEQLGLKNVQFIFGDVMEIGRESHGEFDFIIAHGLYSWVPAPVREKVLAIYSECLTEQGIGYISYNAYPGCHLREMAWNMMRYRVDPAAAPLEQVNTGVQFLATIRDATPNPILRALLNVELEQIANRNFENIFHDDLSSANQPFYFHEFNRDIEARGLQFLTDVDPLSVSELGITESEASTLNELGGDRIQQSQYADLLTWSRFRNSLVCRANIQLNDRIEPSSINNLQLFTDAKPPADLQIADGVEQAFTATRGGNFAVTNGLTKLALKILESLHPQSLTIDELLAEASAAAQADGSVAADPPAIEGTRTEIAALVEKGVIRCRLCRSPHTPTPGERPFASPFARWQAESGFDSLTSLAGFNLEIEDKAMIELLKLLDGTRTRVELAAEMLQKFDVPEEELAEFEKNLPALIESQLAELARAAYLSA